MGPGEVEIDAVVTWVDGADPVHMAARARFTPEAEPGSELDLATKMRRFRDNGELRHCLRSLRNHAPWLRTVWLLTDDQTPAFLDPDVAAEHGVRLVSHRHIFRGHEDLLPSFNSLSIETFLWRIEGLADRFLYLNDDMMLTGGLERDDFFTAVGGTVLRGKWTDWLGRDNLTFHGENKVRGAERAGYSRARFFSPGHAVYPMRIAPLVESYSANPETFAENARPRFRERGQFWPVSFAQHRLIAENAVETRPPDDVVHFPVTWTALASEAEIARRLWWLRKPQVKMTCINFMEEVLRKVPDAWERLAVATGPAAPWERDQA